MSAKMSEWLTSFTIPSPPTQTIPEKYPKKGGKKSKRKGIKIKSITRPTPATWDMVPGNDYEGRKLKPKVYTKKKAEIYHQGMYWSQH